MRKVDNAGMKAQLVADCRTVVKAQGGYIGMDAFASHSDTGGCGTVRCLAGHGAVMKLPSFAAMGVLATAGFGLEFRFPLRELRLDPIDSFKELVNRCSEFVEREAARDLFGPWREEETERFANVPRNDRDHLKRQLVTARIDRFEKEDNLADDPDRTWELREEKPCDPI